jgi:hypothetical protein
MGTPPFRRHHDSARLLALARPRPTLRPRPRPRSRQPLRRHHLPLPPRPLRRHRTGLLSPLQTMTWFTTSSRTPPRRASDAWPLPLFQPQRGCATKPRVGASGQPWVNRQKTLQPRRGCGRIQWFEPQHRPKKTHSTIPCAGNQHRYQTSTFHAPSR